MARFYGAVGYITVSETSPGVWTEVPVERNYYGDVLQDTRSLQTAEQVNDDLIISNRISIIADPFAYENFHNIRYVTYMGTRWKATKVEVQFPRLILTIGGVYNGQT